MAKEFLNTPPRPTDPPKDMFALTPDDNTDYPNIIRQLVIATGGTLRVQTLAGNDRTVTVKDDQVVTCMITKVYATGTTATISMALI